MNIYKLGDLIPPPKNLAPEKVSKWEALKMIAITILIILLVLLIGKWLWNETLVKYTTFARPLPSIWPLLGIMILISLLFGAAR